ncbi:hypothetical protein BG015_000448 [Linnemannia schmuckeri]|uniref:Letm1 RBD domain-containing protein n=1 Tax=Linnemannia schmuckeri TaxID=64567 RepID=A0A9P5S6R2_9FUNG|nr:hypothetical protein BG015_000448 [Linnemannia schmuckeri]
MIRVARLFGDELTVDNLSRLQLLSMCRYMNLNAFGTDNFLRYRIRTSMSSIRKDDKISDRPDKVLHATLSSLPNSLLHETELHHSEQAAAAAGTTASVAATATDPELKLKMLQQQEELIASEKAQEEEIRKLCMEQAWRLAEEQSANAAPIFLGFSYSTDDQLYRSSTDNATTTTADATDHTQGVEKLGVSISSDSDQIFVKEQQSTPASTTTTQPKSYLTTTQLLELCKALFVMTSPSSVIEERVKLEGLKEQQAQQAQARQQDQGTFFSHDTVSSSQQQQHEPKSTTTVPGTKAADRLLDSRVEKMISKLDEELQAYESYSQEKFKLMEINDRNELTVTEKLDINGDGLIQLDHIFELADLVEQEEGTGGIIEKGVVVDGSRLKKTDNLKDS